MCAPHPFLYFFKLTVEELIVIFELQSDLLALREDKTFLGKKYAEEGLEELELI